MDHQLESVQRDNGRYQVQAQTKARRVADLVRAIESPKHGFGLPTIDARPGITDAHDRLPVAAGKADFDIAPCRGEFDGIVDQIGYGLEQQVAVAAHLQLAGNLNAELDTLVFRDRLVDIADFPQHLVQR